MVFPHRIRRIVAIGVSLLMAIGVLILLLMPHRPVDDDLPVRDGLPESAVGYGGLVALLRAQNIPVTYQPIDYRALHAATGLVIFAPASPKLGFPDYTAPMHASLLYVPPKWILRHDTDQPNWVKTPGTLPAWSGADGLNLLVAADFSYARGMQRVHWRVDRPYGDPNFPEPSPVFDLRTFESP